MVWIANISHTHRLGFHYSKAICRDQNMEWCHLFWWRWQHLYQHNTPFSSKPQQGWQSASSFHTCRATSWWEEAGRTGPVLTLKKFVTLLDPIYWNFLCLKTQTKRVSRDCLTRTLMLSDSSKNVLITLLSSHFQTYMYAFSEYA